MMTHPSKFIVVRQNALIFVVFVLGGLLFCVFPWYLNGTPVIAQLFFVFLGITSLATGVLGWKSSRIGLIVDRLGIWCGGYSLRGPVLIPWKAIIGARKVTLQSWEGTHDFILFGLHDDVEPPCGTKLQAIMQKELRKKFGDIELANAMIVGHDEWFWRPDEIADLINEFVRQPAARDKLGEYSAARGA